MAALNACLNLNSTRFIKYVRALGPFLISFRCGMYICDEWFLLPWCSAYAKWARGSCLVVFIMCEHWAQAKSLLFFFFYFALYSQIAIRFDHGFFFSLDLFSAPNENWVETWEKMQNQRYKWKIIYQSDANMHFWKKKKNNEQMEKIVTPANVMHVDIKDNWTGLKDKMQQNQPKTKVTYRINDTYYKRTRKKCLEKEWCWIDDKHMEIKCVFEVCTLDI